MGRKLANSSLLSEGKQKEDDLIAVYLHSGLLDNGDMFDDWWQPRAVFRVTNSQVESLAPLGVSSPSVVPP
jgi:hypothetical protein